MSEFNNTEANPSSTKASWGAGSKNVENGMDQRAEQREQTAQILKEQLSKVQSRTSHQSNEGQQQTHNQMIVRDTIGGLQRQIRQQHAAMELATIVNRSLDETQVAYDIANELHRLLPGTRVSVATIRGRGTHVKAISNQQHFNRRSSEVSAIERMATIAFRSRTDLWHPDEGDQHSPEIRKACDLYDEACDTYALAAVPLFASGESKREPNDLGALIRAEGSESTEVVGVLVVELLQQEVTRDQVEACLRQVSQPIANALANARSHSGLVLMPAWRAATEAADVFRGRHRRKAIALSTAVVAAVLALLFIPADLRLRCNGVLQPISRARVFAEVPGVVNKLHVEAGETVTEGQLLLTLDNPTLSAEIADMEGRLRLTREKLVTSKLQRVTSEFANPAETRNAVLETAALQASLASIEKQYGLLKQKEAQLEIRSPTNGQVVTWDLENRLRNRPVQPGQRLLVVAETAGDWELELKLPDARASYLRELDDLPSARATYVVASQPDSVYEATVYSVAKTAVVDEQDGNVVFVSAKLDTAPSDQEAVRSGVNVVSYIHVKRASLGYCKLYEFFSWARRMWFSYT